MLRELHPCCAASEANENGSCQNFGVELKDLPLQFAGQAVLPSRSSIKSESLIS